jgi:hypothetical protein
VRVVRRGRARRLLWNARRPPRERLQDYALGPLLHWSVAREAREARGAREAFLASAVGAGTGRRRASIRCVAGLKAALKRARASRRRAGHMSQQQPAGEDRSLATATLRNDRNLGLPGEREGRCGGSLR